MEDQRRKRGASWVGSGEAADETVWFGLREKLGATDFLGTRPSPLPASSRRAVVSVFDGRKSPN